ncbi:hypothetical protein MBLNU13_g02376t1 [Cladosporium sp. NU13]
MNAPADQMWSQAPDNMDTMATINGNLEDLSNIFNIDDFDLDSLPNMDAGGFGDQIPQSHPGTHPNTPFDESMGQLGAPPGTAAQDFGGHNSFDMSGQQHFGNQSMVSTPYGADPMYQPSMPQTYPQHQQQNFQFPQQHQHQQPHFQPTQQVPPTPNSLELHGEAGRFMQHQMDAQQRAMLEQQYQMRKEQQVQFTPMASPSTTPYHMNSDFTIPGDFFSPLTSPALHAQNTSNMHQQFMPQPQGYYTNPSTAASSAAPSPIDPNKDVEMGGDGANSESTTQPKKPSRRKPATPRTFALNKVKQSPIQKPQKRKSVALSSIDADIAAQDVHKSGNLAPRSAGFQMPPPIESSENDSVSPEALSDIPMGPPPRPGSAYQSPALVALKKDISGPAATPRSLLSTKSVYDANGPASTGISGQMGQASLEDLELPEAVDGLESEQPTATIVQVSNSHEHTPRLTASRKTPKLGPLSTPSSNRPSSTSGSPAIAPMAASTPAGLLKDRKDAKSGRGTSKKRGSVCTTSAHASPAILPRVSPSIKPLLPEGTNLHSPTHALLLASKSNYQNLLEGNHLPGISYPDSLSTGLTSKRTSHKVAEQGRRNRINDALKEMQSLIPASSGARAEELMTNGGGEDDSPEGKEKDRDAAVKSNSSKAATVESANRYIRVLKETDAAQKAAIAELQKAVDEMRVRLGEKVEPVEEKAAAEGGAAKSVAASPQAMDEAEDTTAAEVIATDAVK